MESILGQKMENTNRHFTEDDLKEFLIMKVIIDGHETDSFLYLDNENPSRNGVYKVENIYSSEKEIKEEKMKVIIELNEYVSIENVHMCENEVKIIFKNMATGQESDSNIVLIDDLKLALRKMTEK